MEGRNFEIRKQLLEYDNVMNRQREVIYAERRKVLEGVDMAEHYRGMIEEVVDAIAHGYSPDTEGAFKEVTDGMRQILPGVSLEGLEDYNADDLTEALIARTKDAYVKKETEIGADPMRHLERMILLDVVDSKWKDHLRSMDNLREGIGLRAYGQKDPLVEYKREAYEAFQSMIQVIKEDSLSFIFRVQAAPSDRLAEPVEKKQAPLQFIHPKAQSAIQTTQQTLPKAVPLSSEGEERVGRNDACPCGSGKKFKKCHGQ